jgi:hypothetical protein
MMKPYQPEKIFVERAVEDLPITRNVLERLPVGNLYSRSLNAGIQPLGAPRNR